MNSNALSGGESSAASSHNVHFPVSFWLIGIIAFFWNFAGLFMFILQISLTPEMIAQMPSDQQALYQNIPVWVMVCFGLATITGTLGSIMLLLQKRWALLLFVISTFAVICQNIYNWFLNDLIDALPAEVIIMPVLIITICIFLVWFSHYSIQQGRLK